jgi:hypothetical protein
VEAAEAVEVMAHLIEDAASTILHPHWLILQIEARHCIIYVIYALICKLLIYHRSYCISGVAVQRALVYLRFKIILKYTTTNILFSHYCTVKSKINVYVASCGPYINLLLFVICIFTYKTSLSWNTVLWLIAVCNAKPVHFETVS